MMQRIAGRLRPPGKLLLAGAALLAAIGPRLRAQPQAAAVGPSGPGFEAASIKRAADLMTVLRTKAFIGIRIDRARVDIGYWSIGQLIQKAYGLQPYQLSGPDWMGLRRFNLSAKFPEGATEAQLPAMLQGLLVERFRLAAHRETKDLAGFALVVGKGGPKMKPAVAGAGEPAEPATNTLDLLFGDQGAKAFGLKAISAADGTIHMEFTKLPMSALAPILASYLHAPVSDLTGLKGRYQATLEFSAAGTAAAANAANATVGDGPPVAPEPPGSSLFSAVKPLGLGLERHKAPVEVLVVDHLDEAPTEN